MLLNPLPADGGGTGATPPAAPPATPPPAPPPPADPTSQLLAENAQLRSWKAQADADAARRTEAARLEEQRKLADKGEIEKLVQKHEQERTATAEAHKAFVERARRTELDRALALALSGKPLIDGAAPQLAKLWRDDFEVADGPNGEFVVRTRDLKTADQVVAERLASREYAHFIRADARGGGGASGGGNPAPSNNPADQAAPRTYEEAVIATWKANQEAAAQGPSWVRGHPFKFPGK